MEHIDVLPRIIEPSMMASFEPIKNNEAVVTNDTCSTEQPTTEAKDVDTRYEYFKQNIVIVLVIISIMVVIYVFYKFYHYRKASSDDTSKKTKHKPKKVIEKQPMNTLTTEEKKTTVDDASKYINLDNDSDVESIDEEPQKEPTIEPLESKITELNINEDDNQSVSSTVSTKDMYVDVKDTNKRQKIDSVIIEQEDKSLEPISIDQKSVEKDIDAILKDLKSEITPNDNNPFILNDQYELKKDEDTMSSTSSTTDKSKPKKITRRPSRTLKFKE